MGGEHGAWPELYLDAQSCNYAQVGALGIHQGRRRSPSGELDKAKTATAPGTLLLISEYDTTRWGWWSVSMEHSQIIMLILNIGMWAGEHSSTSEGWWSVNIGHIQIIIPMFNSERVAFLRSPLMEWP